MDVGRRAEGSGKIGCFSRQDVTQTVRLREVTPTQMRVCLCVCVCVCVLLYVQAGSCRRLAAVHPSIAAFSERCVCVVRAVEWSASGLRSTLTNSANWFTTRRRGEDQKHEEAILIIPPPCPLFSFTWHPLQKQGGNLCLNTWSSVIVPFIRLCDYMDMHL